MFHFIYLIHWQRDRKLSTSYPLCRHYIRRMLVALITAVDRNRGKCVSEIDILPSAPSIAQPCN